MLKAITEGLFCWHGLDSLNISNVQYIKPVIEQSAEVTGFL